MSIGAFFTLEQDGHKSGGPCPPSLKSGRATGPPAPPPFRRLCQYHGILHRPTPVDKRPQVGLLLQVTARPEASKIYSAEKVVSYPTVSRLLSSPNIQSGKYNEMDPILGDGGIKKSHPCK